jgi:hypothetical protein
LRVRAALLAKEGPQHVVVFGSGAALFGSPLSGGYSGAKKMNAFIAEYAMGVASRAKRQIRFHCLIPPMSPHTESGADAARAYAQMAGQTFEDFVKQLPSPPSPADIGAAVVALTKIQKNGIGCPTVFLERDWLQFNGVSALNSHKCSAINPSGLIKEKRKGGDD